MATLLAPVYVALFRSPRSFTSISVLRRAVRPPPLTFSRYLLSTRGPRYASSIAAVNQLTTDDKELNDEQPPFSSLEGVLSRRILLALTKEMKLTHMSLVQAAVLPLLPQLARGYDPEESGNSPPRDLLVKARTGTGKTLAFLLPAIEARLADIDRHAEQAAKDINQKKSDKDFERDAKLAYARENVGILIISPTRELANQIAKEALRVTQHLPGFGVRTLVGGENKRQQMRGWVNGRLDIVVATPGRLRDLLTSEPEVKRGISKAKVFILDEADTLLDMGFRDDIDDIKEYLPPIPERQTFLFSATVSPAIRQIAKSSLASNHAFINCVSDNSSPVHAHIPQYHTVLPSASEQIPHLLRLIAHDQLSNPNASKIIVFLPTTRMTQLFATFLRELTEAVLPAGRRTKIFEIHSKRRMESRTNTSDAFRSDKSGASVLITSDVSARGVDYPNVSRVIQVGAPASTDQYIHRVGRTGRAGTKGRGDLVLLPWEMGFINTSLSNLPLKPLTSKDLTSQVVHLASTFDQDPRDFFKDAPETQTPSRHGFMAKPKHFLFHKTVLPVVEDMERSTSELLSKLDEEAISETFMSNLGFYVGLSSELGLSKMEIVEGCKKWAMEALKLAKEPYVSPAFLQRLGVDNDNRRQSRSGRFGGSFGLRSSGDTPNQARWSGRGSTRLRREREQGQSERSSFHGQSERGSFHGQSERGSFHGQNERGSFHGQSERSSFHGRDRWSPDSGRRRSGNFNFGSGERRSRNERSF